MKKIYLLALLCTCFSLSIFADGVEIDGIYYVLDSTNYTASVTYTGSSYSSSNSYSGDVLIPSFVDYNNKTYNVTKIGTYAFYGCSSLTSVTIPNSVLSIATYAFGVCLNVKHITLGNSVTNIGSYAFSGCTKLTSITIPNSVTSIGGHAFELCERLTSIIVETGNTTYDSRDNCNAIIETASNTLIVGFQNSIIPNSVTSIGKWAFCSVLTSVTIPNSIISIRDEAFLGCASLDTVICKANTPPTLGTDVFKSISPIAVLLVPYESIDAYKAIAGYADYFAEIKGFSDVGEVTDTTATLKWLPDSAVIQYDINVYTADTLFAHYVVDGNGQIISSQRFAPSIYHQKLDTTVSSTEYFVISLDGLSAGTNYSYTIDGINAQSAPIYHEEGSFTTLHEGEEGLFDAIADDPRRQTIKILRDGQLYILRNGKTYDLLGR